MDSLNATGVGTGNPSEMDAVSWFIIVLLTCAPFVVFGCVSCTIFCIDCNEDGEVVVLKLGFGARKRMIRNSLVTKSVQDHADLNPVICERALRSRDLHATSNRSTVSTKPDYIDSDCNAQRCAICLDAFEIGENASWAKNTMYCNHAFHTSCIKHWLSRKRTCPVCRYGIILRQDQYVRCNTWSDWCFGRRPRVLYYKKHRELMSKCRESGQYCMGHGLVFPYESPQLIIPYEPRMREMKRMLSTVKATRIFYSDDHAEKVKSNKRKERKKKRRGEIIIRKINSSYDDEILNQLAMESNTRHEGDTVLSVNVSNNMETNDIEAETAQAQSHLGLEESSCTTNRPGTSSSISPNTDNNDTESNQSQNTRLRLRSLSRRNDGNNEDEPRVVARFEDEEGHDDLVVPSGRREFRRSRLRSGILSEVMDRSTSVDNIRDDGDTV